MNHHVKACVVCGGGAITTHWQSDRIAIVVCPACRRIVQIEFDPPDDPDVRGRIDVLFDPHEESAGDPL